jgi:hypothetical protein
MTILRIIKIVKAVLFIFFVHLENLPFGEIKNIKIIDLRKPFVGTRLWRDL